MRLRSGEETGNSERCVSRHEVVADPLNSVLSATTSWRETTQRGAAIGPEWRRAAEIGSDWTRDGIVEHEPFFAFTYVESFASRDFTDAGLAPAGAQEATHEVSITLWEMGNESSDDQFLTATP